MIEAVVQTGTFETPYRRAGRGGPVLLLASAEPAGQRLFDDLAGRFRTIAPVLPPGLARDGMPADSFEAWLRGLIDGLGLERPALVAGAAHGLVLLRFAGLDPDRVERLALVSYGRSDAPAEQALREAAAATLRPVLLVRLPDVGEPEARAPGVATLLEFLGRRAAERAEVRR